jgi:hypothetical protein
MHHPITSSLCLALTALFLGLAPCPAADQWKPAAAVKLDAIKEMIDGLKAKDPATLRQPTLLAYKTAVFLASGATDTPTIGTSQKIEAKYSGGEENFTQAIVTVEFTGYADDSLTGERFTLTMSSNEESEWTITKMERTALGRGDQK